MLAWANRTAAAISACHRQACVLGPPMRHPLCHAVLVCLWAALFGAPTDGRTGAAALLLHDRQRASAFKLCSVLHCPVLCIVMTGANGVAVPIRYWAVRRGVLSFEILTHHPCNNILALHCFDGCVERHTA